MIKFKNKPEDWMDRIVEALDFRLLYGQEKLWNRMEAMYANLKDSGAADGPNLIHEMAETIEARLNIANPAISIYPSAFQPSSLETAPIVQAIDRWMMQNLEVLKRRQIKDEFVLKIGHMDFSLFCLFVVFPSSLQSATGRSLSLGGIEHRIKN